MDPFLQEYLERLGARLDAYTNAITSLTEKLDAHVVNTPTIAHNPPSSATSPESTTDASAPVPDVSCSTTKAQEIPTVAHDATPICIPMVPVTCSTECSSQVDAIHSINEVHDAATVAADVRNTTTALGPELAVDLCITMAAIDVATCGHHDKLDALNIPAAVSISPLLHVQVPSPKGIPDSTRHVDVGRADEYALVAATPDVAIELAVLPGASSFINKAHGASAVLHGAPLCCITMVPLTCSTECLNQDKGTLVFLPPITTMSLLPAAAPILVTDRLHSGTDAIDSMQLFRNHDLDLPPTRHHGLRIRPMPWPSLWRDIADGSEVRPFPWPSFPVKKFMEHPFQFVQLLDMGLTSSTSPMESCHVGDLVGNHGGHCIRLISVELSYLWPLQQNNVGSCPCKHVKLFPSNKQWLLELCTCTVILALEVHHSCLATTAVHGVRSVKNRGAWNTASSFCLQLIQLEPVLPSDLASITEQRQLISDKYPCQHVVFELRYEIAYCSQTNHYYWYLQILRMLVVQTVQVAKEILDSDFSLFAIGAFLFGHKQRFLWTPYTAKFLVFHRANSAPGYFSVCDRRRCCSLVLLDVFRVLCYELMLATGIQPRLSECQPGDWFPDVILNVCNTYIPEPSLAKFQALKKCECEHLISTGAFNLFMDKGCLKCHMVLKESDSTMLQTSRIQCVQPRCYYEVGSTPAYLKLKVVDAAVIYMFGHRNNWDWELLIHFKHPPDPASIWECISDRRFPRDKILLMIFHPWPSPVAAMFTQQLLFPMTTITGFVTLLKIYARLCAVGIAHWLGSKSASARHLKQSWDPAPGDKTLSVQISHPWGDITHCRILFHDGHHVVTVMQFSSGFHKEHFQGGNSPSFVPSSHLQPSTILMVHIISKGAPAMSGKIFSTGYNQDHCQERGGVIIVVAVFTQRLVDNEHYLGFYRDSDHVQEHRVHWDPGGWRWSAWGQAEFQEGGDVRSLLGPAPFD